MFHKLRQVQDDIDRIGRYTRIRQSHLEMMHQVLLYISFYRISCLPDSSRTIPTNKKQTQH